MEIRCNDSRCIRSRKHSNSGAACLMMLAAAAVLATGSLRATVIVAAGGDAPPRGTGVFAEGLGIPVLNNTGQAVFVSNLREGGFLTGGGLFRGDGTPGSIETIALSTDPLPDATGNFGSFSWLHSNASGRILAYANLQNALSANWGLFRFDGSAITEIVRDTQSPPGGNGQIVGVQGIDISLNESGRVAFFARLQNTTAGNQAVYRHDGEMLTEIARLTQPVRGGEGTFNFLTPLGLSVNESGEVLFAGSVRLENPTRFVNGLFRGDGLSTTLMVRNGEAAPDGNGILAGAMRPSALNDRGETAFIDLLTGTQNGTADNQGLMLATGSELSLVARKGDFVPDGNGRYLQFIATALNHSSQVLFLATISGAANGADQGIFSAHGTNITAVARRNDPAPGGGRFFNFGTQVTSRFALNQNGQAVFYAEIDLEDGGGGNDTFGLFFYDPAHGLSAVAREGDSLPGLGPITLIQFAGSPVELQPSETGFNDAGQVAYRCHAGGEVAIAMWSPPTEPDGAGTAVVTNASPGTGFNDDRVFRPGAVQSVAVTVTGLDTGDLSSVSVTFPEEWPTPASADVSLSGSGFSGASASISGRTITVTGASVNDWATGTVTVIDVAMPAVENIPGLGSAPVAVSTAVAGGTLTPIAAPPGALFIVPIERVRRVNENGVALGVGQTVALEGVAIIDSHVINSTLAAPRFTTYLQDATAGVAIDGTGMSFYNLASVGSRYLVIGTVSHFSGLTQISLESPADILYVGPDNAPEPISRSIAQLLADPEGYEGMLVRIPYLSRAAETPVWPVKMFDGTGAHASIPVTDGSGELIFFVNHDTNLPNQEGENNEPAWPVDVVGIFNQFDSTSPFTDGYQIIPRSLADLHPASEPPAGGFVSWQQAKFGGNAGDVEIAGPAADPEGDGVPNLLEYALGGEPAVSSLHLLPEVGTQDGFLTITFRRGRDATDITYRVEASADTLSWSQIWTSATVPYSSSGEFTVVTVTDTVAIAAAGRRFLRLVVAQNSKG